MRIPLRPDRVGAWKGEVSRRAGALRPGERLAVGHLNRDRAWSRFEQEQRRCHTILPLPLTTVRLRPPQTEHLFTYILLRRNAGLLHEPLAGRPVASKLILVLAFTPTIVGAKE